MGKLPRVVIVGRTNVGKSTLFNRLSVDVKSLTMDQDGVTRDFIKDVVDWQGCSFELLDTGGVSLRKTTDPILQKVRNQALGLIEQADLLLFVCDGTVGIVPEDREISKLIHKTNKEALLVINKIDTNVGKESVLEFKQLGFANTVSISAQHGTGIADLLEFIVDNLPKRMVAREEERRCKVVLLGKPNVGKSSLMNLLLKRDRSLVSDIPGTTREAFTESIAFYKEDILLTDTAGVRRKRRVDEPLEKMMVKSTLSAVEDADIVLLLIDASDGTLADQELKLAFYAFQKKYKAVVLLFNKQDLTTELSQADLKFDMERYTYFIKKINQLDISCKTGQNVGKIMPMITKIWKRYSQRSDPLETTAYLKEWLLKKPLFRKTVPLKLYWVEQVATAPVTFLLKVNVPSWFGPSQLTFLENLLRRKYDFKGVPIKFIVRKK